MAVDKSKLPRYTKTVGNFNRFQTYNPEEDYVVPHNGQVDEETGMPRYDESPIRGGHMVIREKAANGVVVETHINSKGHEIDPETGDATTPAEVINPERYQKKEDEEE